jgi:hypothetical protein
VIVTAYVDHRCDSRNRPGVDLPVSSGARVDIVAGAELLGAELGWSGTARFRLPSANGADFTFEVPDRYEMCPSAPNPVHLDAGDFASRGPTRVDFRVTRTR